MYYMLLVGYILSAVAWIARTEGEPAESFDTLSSPAPGSSFQCQRPGRFSNPDDASCRTYLTCIPDTDPDHGPFTLRQDECGVNALFSGRYQRCITGTDCATLEDFYAIEYECYECGKFVLPSSTDCRQFVNCLKTKDPGVFVPIRQSCPAGKLFSGEAHACVPEEDYECGADKPTTTPKLGVSNVSPSAQVADATFSGGHLSDFVCLSPGRFPDESVPHCRGYRWCTSEHIADQPHSGRLVSRNFLCESDQVFSEIEKRCVPTGSYQCPDDDVSVDRFRCVAVGRFPDRSATGCERYFHCQQTATGTLKATLAQCPTGTVFSWLTTRCVPSAEYVCPVAAIGMDLAIPSETVAVVLPALKQPDSKGDTELANNRTRSSQRNRCSSSGRFANDADVHCRTYFICTRDARGAWARVLVRCPAGTLFSRAASRCVGSETLPQSFCTVTVPSTVPPVLIDLDDDSRDRSDADSEEELECSEPERSLPNPTDRTCRTYFGCRWDEGTEQTTGRFRLHLLKCPRGMVFSTVAARCLLAGSRASEPEHEDTSDEGSSADYSPFCSEPGEDGSGDSVDHSEQLWLSTSTVPAVTRVELFTTEQSTTTTTTITTSTDKLTSPTVPDITERIAPQDGGSFSYSGPVPEYPCTATGRFADINSVDCRSYFLCKLQQPSGSFVSVHLTCPDGMVFSRNVNKCIVSNRHVC
uniref:Chitin-binding type-2 domain-containing protein n=1 Tax=Anopheles stephensi TaxID=30069 RepID=A0A182XYB8_ANOST